MTNPKFSVDILIVGGGAIGRALLKALSQHTDSVLMIDEKPQSTIAFTDTRSIALSSASINIFKALNIWPKLSAHATVINKIHVSEQGVFGQIRLTPKPNKVLGVVVPMAALMQAFSCEGAMEPQYAHKLIAFEEATGLATIETPTGIHQIQAKLVVAADGIHSFLRQSLNLPLQQKDYHQEALVTTITLARPHQGMAFERFTKQGPLAMLPLQGLQSALIWVNDPIRTQTLLHLEEKAFLKTLHEDFGYRLGRFLQVGPRVIYPLSQYSMPELIKNRVVFIGNAAHTLHPIAGQGFNLGLRDVATLVQCIVKEGPTEEALRQYVQLRTHDTVAITHLTDYLVQLFSSESRLLKLTRRVGLMMVDQSTLLRNILSHYASGFGGVVPELACEDMG